MTFLLRIQGGKWNVCFLLTFISYMSLLRCSHKDSNRDVVLILCIHVSDVFYLESYNHVYKYLSWSTFFLPSCSSSNTDKKSLFEIKA